MSEPSTELEKILDEYSGRLSTYGEMYRNMHRNPERLKADQEHAKAVATKAILTLIEQSGKNAYSKGYKDGFTQAQFDKEMEQNHGKDD
jgi:hypothetical protein